MKTPPLPKNFKPNYPARPVHAKPQALLEMALAVLHDIAHTDAMTLMEARQKAALASAEIREYLNKMRIVHRLETPEPETP